MLRFRFAVAALGLVAFAPAQTRPHNFDLLDVKWSVALDEPTATLTGDVTNTLIPNKGAQSIALDFGSLTVDSVTVDGKDAVSEHKAPLLTVHLSAPGDGKHAVAIRIKYHGHPGSGAYFVPASRAFPAHTPVVYTQGEMVDNRFWLPTYDYPDDKATSEGTIDVPQGWFALSNGKLLESPTANGRTRFHWKMDKPHATYLISFSAGPFDEGKGEWDGIPVNFYVPQGLKDQGQAAFGMTPDIVRCYSQITGFRYPYAKYTQSAVPDFMYGGMENITCTTQTIGALHPPSTEPIVNTTGLVAHELAHQWFGDTVTCSGWSDAWINEGWATFMPLFYTREKRGQDAFDIERYDVFQGGLAAHREQPDRPVVFTGYKDALDMFNNFIYPGGASRMLMLMHQVGEHRFWGATKAYLEQRKYTSFDTPAFFDTWSKNLKMDLKPFMKQWFYTAGAPRLTVSLQGSNLVVTQQAPTFNLDLPVWIWSGGNWVKKEMKISGAKSTLDVGNLAGRPALVDPECWIMAEVTNQIPIRANELSEILLAAPNAAEQMRMIDTMLSPLTAQQRLDLAKRIKSRDVLRRYLGMLQDGSQDYLLSLIDGKDKEIADAALGQLGSLPSNATTLAKLRDLAANDANEVTRINAYRILLRQTNDAQLADRLWTMEGFQDQYRQIALDWWAGNKPEIARERALQAIEQGYPEPTRVSAIRHLGNLKDRPGERRVFNALAKVVQEESFGARNTAIASLGAYGDKAAIPLLEPLSKAELVFFRQTAAGALASLRSK